MPTDGIEVLTPGHFLIGRPLIASPAKLLSNSSIFTLKRWNLCQKISSELWKRWSLEYLCTIQRRQKWFKPCRNYKVGDIVLLKDQDVFHQSWPLEVITEVHPGLDGQVRTVTLRTSKGSYKRPVVKLVLLYLRKIIPHLCALGRMFNPTLPPLHPELLLSFAMNYSNQLDILFISIFLLIVIIAHVALSHGYRQCFRHRCCLDTLFTFCFHFFPVTFIVNSVKLKNCLRLIKLFAACSDVNSSIGAWWKVCHTTRRPYQQQRKAYLPRKPSSEEVSDQSEVDPVPGSLLDQWDEWLNL